MNYSLLAINYGIFFQLLTYLITRLQQAITTQFLPIDAPAEVLAEVFKSTIPRGRQRFVGILAAP